MKAIVQKAYGGTETLRLADIPRPVPAAGEVLVRVRAAGVDPGVWHLMSGQPYLLRLLGFGLRAPKVSIRGRDVAGLVQAVGSGVTDFRPGDEVFGIVEGSFAEYACAPADRFLPMPAGLDFERAAAIPISGLTALQGLRGVSPGQRVLIIGAAGGVGSYAVQLAKSLGTHVTGVCSTAKIKLVKALGADKIIDYTRESIPSEAYDFILDTAGARTLSDLRRMLVRRGTLVIVGAETNGRWFGGVDRILRAGLLSPFVSQKLAGLMSKEDRASLLELHSLVTANTIRPVIDRTYPLADAAAAITYVHSGHSAGKVVLTV